MKILATCIAEFGKTEWRGKQILRLFMTEVGSQRSALLHYLTVFSDAARAFENDFCRLADRDKILKRHSRTTKRNIPI